jgi:hypothetical protein
MKAEERLKKYGIKESTRHHVWEYAYKSIIAALEEEKKEANQQALTLLEEQIQKWEKTLAWAKAHMPEDDTVEGRITEKEYDIADLKSLVEQLKHL